MSKYYVELEAAVTNQEEGVHEICSMEFPSEINPDAWDVIELAKYQAAFKKHIPENHVLIDQIRIKGYQTNHE